MFDALELFYDVLRYIPDLRNRNEFFFKVNKSFTFGTPREETLGMQIWICFFLTLSPDENLISAADLYLSGIEGIELIEDDAGQHELKGHVYRQSDLNRIQEFARMYPEMKMGYQVDSSLRPKRSAAKTIQPTIFLEVALVEVKKSALQRLGVRTDPMMTFQGNWSKGVFDFGTADPVRGFLDLAMQNGEARVHAKQSVMTENGKEGEFKVGGEFPIKVVSGLVAKVEFKNFGIRLRFRPHIQSDSVVHLELESEISEIDSGSMVDGLPVIQSKVLKTQLNTKFNQTMAIGGVVRASESTFSDKIPGLSAIPGLGRLFRSEDFKKHQSEAYLFMTSSRVNKPWLPSPEL